MSYRAQGPALVPPPTSGWTWYNQSSSTATQVGGSLNIYTPKNASGDNIVMYYQTPPSTPYTLMVHLPENPATGNSADTPSDALHLYGIAFTDGTATIGLNMRFSSTVTAGWSVLYCANSTTATANLGGYQDGDGFPWSMSEWLMIRNDGTSIFFAVGDHTGKNFHQVYHEAKGLHLGSITGIGFYSDTAAAAPVNYTCDSWQVLAV